jgi:Rad3-related DNA helicase
MFNLLVIPVGGGKSAIYMGFAQADDDLRFLFLTANKNLQDQLYGDFAALGLKDVRGRSNYLCNLDVEAKNVRPRTAATAKCASGVFCERLIDGDCDWVDARKIAGRSRLVVSNYDTWLYDEERGDLGQFDVIVCDEAHLAPDKIGDFTAVEIQFKEVRTWGLGNPVANNIKSVIQWAIKSCDRIENRLVHKLPLDVAREGRDLLRRLGRLRRLSQLEWINTSNRYRYRWALVDPGQVAAELLFRHAKKVVLSSATIRKKTLDLLGVKGKKAASVKVMEQESNFPIQRRPIYYMPVARMGRNTDTYNVRKWHDLQYDIVRDRTDRNGVIHSISYDRAQEIHDELTRRFKKDERPVRLLLHKRGVSIADFLAEFKASPRGTCAISPAISTGVDLAYTLAEYQIIPKMPFPDFSDPLLKVRMKRDSKYVPYVTMQTLVQMYGRVDRAPDDQGETFILDAHFGWLKAANFELAPRYFHAAIKTLTWKNEQTGEWELMKVPAPPPRLKRAA